MAGIVNYSVDGAIARIAFSNPEKRNAMSLGMWEELSFRVASALTDSGVRVVLLAGDGSQAFVSGSDVSGFAEGRSTVAATLKYNETVEASLSALANSPKPTLAVIRGFCIGGGISIAAACDLRIADEKASFAIPAARLGVGYSSQQIARLQQIVGPAVVRDLIFTGRRLTAEDALRVGLVSRVVAELEIVGTSDELAAQIAASAPLTIAAAKRASAEALLPESERHPEALAAAIAACFASEDYKEGQRAFAEKRRPIFSGS